MLFKWILVVENNAIYAVLLFVVYFQVPPAAAGAQSSNSQSADNVSDLYAEINTGN